MLWLHYGIQIRHVVFVARVAYLRHVLLLLVWAAGLSADVLYVVAIVVGKGAAKIHHLLLARIL